MAIQNQLQPGEEILYVAHVSRISLAPWWVALAVVVAGGLVGWHATVDPQTRTTVALVVGALALILLARIGIRLLVLRTTEHVLTNRRILQQVGVLAKRSMDAPLDKINNVEHWQSLWGRLLHFGDVEIDTASEHGATRFRNISHPLEFKNAITGAVDAFRSARFGPAPVAAGPSGAERLRQLKQLLDEGLISQEEFEAKRQRLMEEI
jgi:uncharacterized membrane protein YdbT with pleckstrin-like domain